MWMESRKESTRSCDHRMGVLSIEGDGIIQLRLTRAPLRQVFVKLRGLMDVEASSTNRKAKHGMYISIDGLMSIPPMLAISPSYDHGTSDIQNV